MRQGFSFAIVIVGIIFGFGAGPLPAQVPLPPDVRGADLTGAFRDDGTCQVFANGSPTFAPADSAETTYIREGTFNMAPPGFEVHEIWCAPRSPDEPMLPITANDRVFIVMLFAPTGKLAQPRTYQVHLGLPSSEKAPYRAGAALFGMSQQKINDTLPLRTGLLYLAGTRGTVTITQVAPERIVGTFLIHAQASITM
jgi:hypothetical protein